jgi:hypothetical protein
MANVYLPDAIDTAIGNPIQSSWGGEVRAAIEAAAPAASVGMITTDIAPDGWLAMIGQTVTGFQQSYPVAWTRIPTAWKTGSSVVFPDTRARIMIGAAGYGDFILGSTGGLNEAALTIGNLPPHSHGGLTNSENAAHEHAYSGTTGGSGLEHVWRDPAVGSTWWSVRDTNGDGIADGNSFTDWSFVGMRQNYSGDHSHPFSGATASQNRNHQHQVYQEGNGVPVSRMQAHLAITFIMRVY